MTKKKNHGIVPIPQDSGRGEPMGSVFRHTHTVTLPNGTKRKYLSKKWYLEFRTPDGKRIRRPGYTDYTATKFLLGQLEQEAARIHAGMLPSGIGLAKIPLAEHLREFLCHLRGKGDGAGHVDQVDSRCRAVLAGCKFERWADLSAPRVSEYLAGRRRDGLGIQTTNNYLRQFRSFVTWLARRIQAFDPLATLQPQNAETDRRHVRRSLTDEQFGALLAATEKAGVSFGLSGSDRAMLYLTAAYTGFRAKELASLTPGSFALDAPVPTVTVAAAYSKHRREDVQPLPGALVERLRSWFSAAKAGAQAAEAPLWPGCWARYTQAAKMLRPDLEAAGIPYEIGGRVFDFHALRVFYVTALHRAGVSLTEAQRLARHSDPRLTSVTYGRLELHDLAGAIGKLPPPGGARGGARQAGRGEGRRKQTG